MEVVYEWCAGLDVHKKSVTACRRLGVVGIKKGGVLAR